MVGAIQTQYRGYLFRSRLEARWAVFFDCLGVRFEYEKEGFDLGSNGYYLPDFWLPKIKGGIFIEVKGTREMVDAEACEKLSALINNTNSHGLMVCGDPYLQVEGLADWGFFEPVSPWVGGPQDTPYLFCTCPWCGTIGIEFDGRGARVCGQKCSRYTINQADEKAYSFNDPTIVKAAVAARSARFEHLKAEAQVTN